MLKITEHPILDIEQRQTSEFLFEGQPVTGEIGLTIAAALHQAGFPVHSHSLKGRNRRRRIHADIARNSTESERQGIEGEQRGVDADDDLEDRAGGWRLGPDGLQSPQRAS